MVFSDISLVIISFLVIIIFGFNPNWIKKKYIDFGNLKSNNKIPGYISLPFFGTTWVIPFYGFKLDKINEYYDAMFKKFGNIFKEEYYFNFPIINICDRSDIEKVFKATGKYPIRPPTEVIAYYRKSRPDRYKSVGIVNEQGEKWHYLRSNLTTGLISPSTISNAIPQIENIADDWCFYLKQNREKDGTLKGIEELASNLALEVTCALVLGRRMGFLLPENDNQLSKRLAKAVQDIFRASRDTHFGLPWWKVFPSSAFKMLQKGEEEAYDIAMELIRTADDATKDSPIFQSVINAKVDEREKIAVLVDYISAGIFTLSNSLTFLLHFIGSNPDVQEKLYRDVCDGSLVYAKACVNESFRLLPSANPLARVVEEDLILSGYPVKKGSVVLCHTAFACRNEKNFYKANEFIPERWLGTDNGYKPSASAFLVIPFGVGKRLCPGKRFIEIVMPIVLSQTVRNFSIVCKQPLEVQFEFLFSPKGPVSISLTTR